MPGLHSVILKFTSATFMAAEMPLWLGPGYKFLQRAWSACTDQPTLQFVLKLNACLAELGWGGWKLVALPLLLKATASQTMLDFDPRKILGVLATLKKSKKFSVSDTDLVWKDRFEKFALARLEKWTLSPQREPEVARELEDILTLSNFFSPAVSPIIIGIIDGIHFSSPEDTVAEYRATPANSAWALGMCMQTLEKRDPAEWATRVDLASWTKMSAQHWGWSPAVLGGLYGLSQAR